MPVILAGLVILLLAVTSMQHVASAQGEYRAAALAAAAMNFRNYIGHIDNYVRRHPETVGEISIAELTMPAWYTPRAAFRNYVTGGIGFGYVRREDIADVDALLAKLTPVCPQCGIKRASQVVAPDGRIIGGAPPAIPEGSLVRRL